MRASVEFRSACQIAGKLRSSARKMMQSISSSLSSSPESRTIVLREHKHTYDIWIGKGKKAEERPFEVKSRALQETQYTLEAGWRI